MRAKQFVKAFVITALVSLTGVSITSVQAQPAVDGGAQANSWVLTSWSVFGATVTKINENEKLPNGNFVATTAHYLPFYDPFSKLLGWYVLSRKEINCVRNSAADRDNQIYSLLGIPDGDREQSFGALQFAFPGTVARFEMDSLCRLAGTGVTEGDTTFSSVSDFIEKSKIAIPPVAPPRLNPIR